VRRRRGLEFIETLSGSRFFRYVSRLLPRRFAPAGLVAGFFCLGVLLPSSTETAIANGDTRTLYLYHAHTGESIDATYRVDGHYDPAVLEKLNWFLRDWRRNEATNMDPRLFDAVWETYRGAGADSRIIVLCGYRSPQTNAMLRRRSRAVAQHSQHMLGKAMDTTMPGMSMERIREYAMRLQMGGVGYYPSSNFVHIDVGGVRAWPRMSYDQLVRLFPDGKTVHIAADGRTLPGYEEARAEIEADGGAAGAPPPAHGGNFFAWLFRWGSGDEDEHDDSASASAPPAQPAGDTYVADASNNADADTANASSADPAQAPPDNSVDETPATGQTASDALPVPPVPEPPRRPVDLASLSDVPTPPARPNQQVFTLASAELRSEPTSQDQISDVVASAPPAPPALPGIITQGPDDGRTIQNFTRLAPASRNEALAYAPVGQMEGLRSAAREGMTQSDSLAEAAPGIVPARLDPSDFRSLTESTETAEMKSQTIFGPTLTGLRRAAQVETAALSSSLEDGYLARFGVEATDLAANRFAGPSVASLDTEKQLMVLVASSDFNAGGN
jgi:uncharacterized protein YcbK (DUF882 family)